MAEIKIVETENIDPEDIDVSRWADYGKDRLYINKFGTSHDDCYADLTGEEGHSTWFDGQIEVEGSRVVIDSTMSKGVQTEERRQAVLEVEG